MSGILAGFIVSMKIIGKKLICQDMVPILPWQSIIKTTNGGGVTGINETITILPKDQKLLQNYPNPFNPATTIQYQVPERSVITIKVYDVLGNEITTLINEEKLAGSYEVEFDATELPSGIYFYRLQADSFVETKKMVFIK